MGVQVSEIFANKKGRQLAALGQRETYSSRFCPDTCCSGHLAQGNAVRLCQNRMRRICARRPAAHWRSAARASNEHISTAASEWAETKEERNNLGQRDCFKLLARLFRFFEKFLLLLLLHPAPSSWQKKRAS